MEWEKDLLILCIASIAELRNRIKKPFSTGLVGYIDITLKMAPKISGQTSIFGGVFVVSKSLLGIDGHLLLLKET